MTRIQAIFVVAALGFILSMFYRVSATVISPMISTDLGLSPMQLSSLSAAFFYAFALFQLPVGIALDHIGARKVMVALGAVCIIGSVCFALAHEVWLAYVGRILLGIGTSCNMMAPLALFMVWCKPERFATLMTMVISLGWVGSLFAATPFAWLSETIGWRPSFLIVSALSTIEFVLVCLIIKDRPEGTPVPETVGGPLFDGLKWLITTPFFWMMSFGALFRFGTLMALQGLWAGPYLRYAIGLDNIQTGNLVFASSLGYICGLPLVGVASDRIFHTRKWIILPAFFVMAALFIFLGLMNAETPRWILFAIFFGLGCAASPGQLIYAQLKELVPQQMSSTALTGINFCNMLGPALMMQIGGMFLPSDIKSATCACDYAPMWHFFAAGLSLSGLLFLFIPDSKPRHPVHLGH